MSYGDSGSAYVPPPPPAAGRRSPWMFVGIGCGALVLLAAILIGVTVGKFTSSIKEEMGKPYDRAAVVKSLGDTPLYPRGKFDEELSKVMRGTMNVMKAVMPADETVSIAHLTEDTPAQVLEWYDAEMAKRGYKPVAATNMPVKADVKQNQYLKDKAMVLVQAQPMDRGDKAGKTMVAVFRFNGFRGQTQ